MRCPFAFANSSSRGEWSECDPECAIRVKWSKANFEAGDVVVGSTCALAAMSCNLEGVVFAPAVIEILDRIDISEMLNEEETC